MSNTSTIIVQSSNRQVANHQIFGSWLLEALREWLKCPIDNQYADTGLDCLVKFLIMMNGSNNQPNTKSHTLFVGCFTFLCITTSQVVDVRVRIYKVIAALLTKLNGAGHLIDIQLIDDLQAKVFDQLCNESEGEVRAQMLSALRWLQHPFDPQCTVTDRYRHHMTHDPAVCVRMVTLASIRRAPHIIPCIVDRLYDIETRVRKYCVLQLCGMPLERMVIEQRWRIVTTLLQEQSDVVKNVRVSLNRVHDTQRFCLIFLMLFSLVCRRLSNTSSRIGWIIVATTMCDLSTSSMWPMTSRKCPNLA